MAPNEAGRLFVGQPHRRSFGSAAVLTVVAHSAIVGGLACLNGKAEPPPAPEHQAVVVFFKAKPPPPNEPPPELPPPPRPHSGSPRPATRSLPPPQVEPVLTETLFREHVFEHPDALELAPLDLGGEAGVGSGNGAGTGTGSGTRDDDHFEPVETSKARRAWFATNNWKCERPSDQREVGRVMVRIRVTVAPDGRASDVAITVPGPAVFNERAIECAREALYLAALDYDGTAIEGMADFGIDFLP